MTAGAAPERPQPSLAYAATVIAMAIGMGAAAWVLYQLLDVVLLVFLGVVLASAVQPWHVQLGRVGVPRGLSVLLIYLLFGGALAGVAVLVVPVVSAQIVSFVTTIPEHYTQIVTMVREHPSRVVALIGRRLPPLESLPTALTTMAPESVSGIFGLTTGVLAFFTYAVTVLAIGFYWTLEVPRFERVVASLISVDRRADVLATWHEIEFKLGAFMRGQGIAMLAVGAASGLGYLLIGLPNALTLALLAGLLEAVPMLGPTLAAVPAVLVALPFGTNTVLLVLGWTILVQTLEGYVLIPRIMSRAVGVSALVGLIAVLAMGVLYGIMGVFIAIPLVGVVQVVADRLMFEPLPMAASTDEPLSGLDARVQALRQRVRRRLRMRDTRMGIDPTEPEHVGDALDQQIETAVDRVAAMLLNLHHPPPGATRQQRAALLAEICPALDALESADQRAEAALESEGTPAQPASAIEEVTRAIEQVDQIATGGADLLPASTRRIG
ncbi:MAG TPA: AI-2E family transporter [Candidatus Binatia bacterium]|jgi:predicted PurR-regulated permease PerM|nr:AI-2E family transporter [Candidatus Binatia bacterium]